MNGIIAIFGHQKGGKSETLNHVREFFRSKGGASLSTNPSHIGDKPETFKYKNQIICVCLGGDTREIVRNNFDYAYSKNADIIIRASRTRGGSANVVSKEGKKNNIDFEWFAKRYECWLSEEAQSKCNKKFAEVVFTKI